jgi:hypothetical protein
MNLLGARPVPETGSANLGRRTTAEHIRPHLPKLPRRHPERARPIPQRCRQRHGSRHASHDHPLGRPAGSGHAETTGSPRPGENFAFDKSVRPISVGIEQLATLPRSFDKPCLHEPQATCCKFHLAEGGDRTLESRVVPPSADGDNWFGEIDKAMVASSLLSFWFRQRCTIQQVVRTTWNRRNDR